MQEFILTTEQRIYYYKKALGCFRDMFPGPFICNVLKWLIVDDDHPIDSNAFSNEIVEKYFPEFHRQLELNKCTFWVHWDVNDEGNQQREQALKAAIAEAESLLLKP